MSSNSSPLQGTNNDDMGTREALIIGAAIIAMLVFLAMLRFCCNIFIDIIILENVEAARRSIAEAVRWAFPRWHVRTQPTSSTTTTSVQVTNSAGQSTAAPTALTSKILTKADLQVQERKTAKHKKRHGDELESVSSHTLMCSICLHELQEGDSAYIGPCEHIFHEDCMAQWVESRGRDCPNCRSEIIPSPIAVNAGDTLPREH